MMRIKRSAKVIWDVIDGVTVLCNTDSTEFFNLNALGALVWDLCEQYTLDDVAERVHQMYPEQEVRRIAADIRDFVLSLEASGLIITQEGERDREIKKCP